MFQFLPKEEKYKLILNSFEKNKCYYGKKEDPSDHIYLSINNGDLLFDPRAQLCTLNIITFTDKVASSNR